MAENKEPASPPTWKMMVSKYFVLLPALMLVAYGIKWSAWDPPLWQKLIAETMLLIPTMHYVITPLVDKALSGWLYKGIDEEQRHKGFL